MGVLSQLDQWILRVIWFAGMPLGLFAFIHALMQRSDAFTAADKLSKPAWLGITGAGLVVLVLLPGPMTIIWIAGLVAVLVYLIDVRPRVVEVQRGPRW